MPLPVRRHPRLKSYDYSQPGYYYVTIHIQAGGELLSRIKPQKIMLTTAGKIAYQQLLDLERRYPYVKIDKFVVMPTHIHAILILSGEVTEKRPGLNEIVRTFKSMTTRMYNQSCNTPGKILFQSSFYETVIRDERTYQEIWRYIHENPAKWLLQSGGDVR